MTELLDAGNHKQLFLDDHAVESTWASCGGCTSQSAWARY